MGKKKDKKKKVLKVNVDDLSKKDLKEVCKKLMKQNKKLRDYLEDFDPKGLREELMDLADKMKKAHKKNKIKEDIHRLEEFYANPNYKGKKANYDDFEDAVRTIFMANHSGPRQNDSDFDVIFARAFRPFDKFDDCEW